MGETIRLLMHRRLKLFLFPPVVTAIQFVRAWSCCQRQKDSVLRRDSLAGLLWPITLHFSAALLKNTSQSNLSPCITWGGGAAFCRKTFSEVAFLFQRTSSCTKHSFVTQYKAGVCPVKDQRSHSDSSQCQHVRSQTHPVGFSYTASESFTLISTLVDTALALGAFLNGCASLIQPL